MNTEKTVLLIGASGGLGNHLTNGLAKAGYNLALHYNNSEIKLNQILDSLNGLNIKYKAYKADITIEKEVEKMAADIKNDFGGIDILINNAGISINAVSWKMKTDDWNKVLSVNLTGPFLCTKHVLPVMKERGWGRVIYMSSVVAQTGVAGTSAYAATKAGLAGLCKTISKEVVKNGITANVISLGYFEAGLLFQIPEDIRSQIKESIPKKEFGDPKEVVECILYLCSNNSSYITGQIINLNGGLY
ncbi:MAG: SDR family oxidoreductase [Chlorobi bacterium]|nr:SDR family oxidoreductase [Chlorobiota bacterium]MCI0714856.1 SDR family oxidoreductase [Chlorobiota bacterium]